MKSARLLGLSIVAAILAGCVRDEPPAPVTDAENFGAHIAAPNQPPPAPIETAGGTVTVRPGQTLYALARDANVPVRALIDANQLQPPYKLQAGQVLTVPHTRQHVVQPGETLYAVARQYGVEASSLARENHLNPPYTIKSGVVLILPAPVETAAAPPVAAPIAAAPPSAGPATITVAPLPPPAKPAPPPPAAAPETPHPPTLLQPTVAPPSAPVQATNPPSIAAAPAPSPPPTPPLPPPAKSPTPPPAAPPPEPETGAKPAPAAEASTAAVATAVANHADPVSPLFLWPVRGRILSVFGAVSTGAHNDGVNIAAPAGTTVSAAEGGVVAYAGNELRGFGNLLLIKHADGWVTAYAHNDVLLVKKGQKVRRGEPIARVGSTGGVNQAQLHFELRRGTKAIDPLDHLPPLTADAG